MLLYTHPSTTGQNVVLSVSPAIVLHVEGQGEAAKLGLVETICAGGTQS